MISRRKFLTASVLGIGAVATTGVVGASQTDPLAKTFVRPAPQHLWWWGQKNLLQAGYPVGGFPSENDGQHGVIGFVGVWLEKDSNPEQRLNWMTSLLERVQKNYAQGNYSHGRWEYLHRRRPLGQQYKIGVGNRTVPLPRDSYRCRQCQTVPNAAICTAYVDRHQTINDFAQDAISHFPEATHIYLWLDGKRQFNTTNYFGVEGICYEKSGTPGEWKSDTGWSVLNWGAEKCYHLPPPECHKYINGLLTDISFMNYRYGELLTCSDVSATRTS